MDAHPEPATETDAVREPPRDHAIAEALARGIVMLSPAQDDVGAAPIRSPGRAANAGLLALLGAPMMAAAVVMMALTGGRGWPILVGSGVLTLCAIYVLVRQAGRRRARVAAERTARAAFEFDHAWPESGEELSAFRGALLRLTSAPNMAMAALMALVVFGQLFTLTVGVSVGGVILIVGLFGALRAGTAPRVRLGYHARPYTLGERIGVRLGLSEQGSAVSWMEVTLRCVRERVVRWTAQKARTGAQRRRGNTLLVRETLWSCAARLSRPDLVPAPGSDIDLEFQPPAGLPETSLSRQPATYWELQVLTRDGNSTQEYRFLLPVYGEAAARSA